MKIGFSLPIFGEATSGASLREMAQLAEDLGFESVWAADHLVMPSKIGTRYEYTREELYPADEDANHLDVFTSLAAAAALTSTVRIGSNALIVPYRHPLETAKMLACLDVISEGRLLVGLGVGWMAEEFDALGVPYHERGARTDEIIDIWKKLWADGRATHEGRFYHFQDLQSLPRPIQQPNPPLLVGGYSTAALRRVAERGDGWLAIVEGPDVCYGPTGRLSDDLAMVRDTVSSLGKDPASIDLTGMLFSGPRANAEAFVEDYEAYEAAGLDRMIVTFPALTGDRDTMLSSLGVIASSGHALRT